MWPFKKKIKPELSCIAKTILAELETLDYKSWVIKSWATDTLLNTHSNIYHKYNFYHPGINYGLSSYANEKYTDFWDGVSIIGVDDSTLTWDEQRLIWRKLIDIFNQVYSLEEEKQSERDEKRLTEFFPKCFNNSKE
jgi:hypothetical protein